MELRPYQRMAVDAIWRHVEQRDDNPCCVLPTGAGKSLVIATLCRDVLGWGGKALVLVHVKELIEQNVAHLLRCDPSLPVGVYSAGLGLKQRSQPVIVGGIQSVARADLSTFSTPDVIIVDEAHRIPADGEGQYRSVLEAFRAINPNVRLIGLTATPYRTSSGQLCTPDGLLNRICFEVGIRELVRLGHLVPVHAYASTDETDTSALEVVRGEFNLGQMEALFMPDQKIALAVADLLGRCASRKSVLVFSAGVEHGRKVAELLAAEGETVGQIYGDTDGDERRSVIEAFKSGRIKYLVNCNVLTTGFDAPAVDAVALIRATASPGLYYQMLGRGFRPAPDKADCLVVDFGENVKRFGPVDAMDPDGDQGDDSAPKAKKCPECLALLPLAARSCDCGYQFPPPEKRDPNHGHKSYTGEVLSNEAAEVLDVRYRVHRKKGAQEGHPATLRVDYDTGIQTVSEFICLGHGGFARTKAEEWWARRAGSDIPAPPSAEDALPLTSALLVPTHLKLVQDGKYPRIVAYKFAEKIETE